MKSKSLLLVIPVLLVNAACSTFQEPKKAKPAPQVVRPKTSTPQQSQNQQAKKPSPPAPSKPPVSNGTATYAIDPGRREFKIEPSQPTLQAQPLEQPVITQPPIEQPDTNFGQVQVPPPPQPAISIEDAQLPSGSPPAVIALLTDADRSRASGDLDAAVFATERALRIDSRNPVLTYKLAQLRLKQNRPQQAEELAGKAALLAGNNSDLKRKSWLLIAEARRIQQNYQGSKDAKAKADSFIGR
ncbi:MULTISPECIES: tetratricopeptide repeat protein [Methylomonas]|uniref:tetratricopeptide repeat protein n=1 Tax=Methylomonas TaxID=416 RepID=UPI001232292F|nr:tetratricopeptide repeat protein [Methylomonas rhizoryzae]